MADYRRLAFVAKAWKEIIDPTTGVRTFEAVNRPSVCELEIQILPGTEPPEVVLNCVPDGCTTRCELVTEVSPDGGTDYYCNRILDGSAKSSRKAKKRVKS